MPAGTYVKVSARKWIFEVSTDARATWTQIKGINKFGLSRSATKTDDTDFTDDGKASHEIMERNGMLKIEGFFLEDSTGARDPGQAATETFSELVGAASIGDFRATSPNGKRYTFSASVEIGDVGGGNNDKSSWSATFNRDGAITIT